MQYHPFPAKFYHKSPASIPTPGVSPGIRWPFPWCFSGESPQKIWAHCEKSGKYDPKPGNYLNFNIWVFQNLGIITENPIKMDDLGVPLFSETSISPKKDGWLEDFLLSFWGVVGNFFQERFLQLPALWKNQSITSGLGKI